MEPPLAISSTPLQKAKGICYAVLILCSSFLGTLYVLTPMLPLAYLYPKLFRRVVDFLVGFWLVLPSALMELIFGVQLHIHGDEISHKTSGLIIMNHRTRLDWLFFWNALWRMNPRLLTTEKISLKGILKYLPGAGWAMAFDGFLFLDRSFDSDKARIDLMTTYYANAGNKYQLLLFPEGTDKCPLATERSRHFAKKQDLNHYKHVLHPRTLGFVYLLQRMRKEKCVDFVYDVTVAYGDQIVQSEVDLILHGLTPMDVHFLVQKIPTSSLPTNDKELAEWLKDRWEEKERLLHNFYEEKTFKRKNGYTNEFQEFPLTPSLKKLQIAVLFLWLVATAVWMYIFLTFVYQFWLAAFTSMFIIGIQFYYGGFELFLAHLSLLKEGCPSP